MKISPYTIHGSDVTVGYSFECPGCKMGHHIQTAHLSGYNWTFNGDVNKPTFSPSLLVKGNELLTDDEVKRVMAGEKIPPRPFVCHSYIRNGKIEFLGDCTHSKKGQTVELPEVARD